MRLWIFRARRPQRPGPERRNARRYAVEGTAAELVLDERGARRLPVEMLDLSHDGARVRGRDAPRPGEPAWLHWRPDGSSHWAEVALVAAHPDRDGAQVLRLRFLESCPYPVFKHAVAKSDLQGRPEAVSPEFETRLWR
jgi:hypothetical protein